MKRLSAKERLELQGYLTVNQLKGYLAEVDPLFATSYPPLMRIVRKEGSPIPAMKVGGQHRIEKKYIDAYVDTLQKVKGGAIKPLPDPPEPSEKVSQALIPTDDPDTFEIETQELGDDPQFTFEPLPPIAD